MHKRKSEVPPAAKAKRQKTEGHRTISAAGPSSFAYDKLLSTLKSLTTPNAHPENEDEWSIAEEQTRQQSEHADEGVENELAHDESDHEGDPTAEELVEASEEPAAGREADEYYRRFIKTADQEGPLHIDTGGNSAEVNEVLGYVVKKRLAVQWAEFTQQNDKQIDAAARPFSTLLQSKLFPYINSYYDVLYTRQTVASLAELRELYVLHALNHVLKTRDLVLTNTERLRAAQEKGMSITVSDQGFTRPKVLILVPFRQSALDLVQLIMRLAPKLQQERVMNKARFFDEFREEPDTAVPRNKPQDWQELFRGNIDDCFRLGISFTRQTMRLYAPFYRSDILIASPLGLRMIVGVPGDARRDYDFLSSIELVIVDQADVLSMQNWEHVVVLFEHLNLLPAEPRDTDFSRVKPWYLEGNAKHYRQTVVLSAYLTAEMNALFKRFCFNPLRVKIWADYPQGSIVQVVSHLQQVFQRIDVASPAELDDARFNYFQKHVYPRLKKSVERAHSVIFIPSYFDYVRVRNLFKFDEEDDVKFVVCSEYTPLPQAQRARTLFTQGRQDFLLVTERFYFYRRCSLGNVRHVVFYSLPQNANFYAEILNHVKDENGTCLVLYTKFDSLELERIVGSKRAKRMLSSDKTLHMFC